jgi:hypothetical protein
MKPLVCNSAHGVHVYLAKRKAPVSELTAWKFHIGNYVPWSEEICIVISKKRKKHKSNMEIWRQYPHITGLYLYTSNLEKFGEKSDADSIKTIKWKLPFYLTAKYKTGSHTIHQKDLPCI